MSKSDNLHEAEQATLKAHFLLAKYNLQEIHSQEGKQNIQEEELSLKRVLKAKRSHAKLDCISSILRTFFVHPVINYARKSVYLEIFGTFENVSIAEHVSLFLDKELERLWLKVKKENPFFKGLAKKNSFFRGVSKGYCQKIESQKNSFPKKDQNSLIVVEKALTDSLHLAYPKLSKKKSSYQHCPQASQLGFEEGRSLMIQTALENQNSSSDLLTKYLIGN